MALPRLVPYPGEFARCSIGGFTFPLNPQDIQETNPRNVVEAAGIAGPITYDFGNGVRRWQIAGQVGQAGRPAILEIEKLKARDGQPAPTVRFAYPYKYGHRTFLVKVGDLQMHEQAGDNAFQFQYSILLREAAPNTHQAPVLFNGQFAH
jgi:hypothetical protein